jgi:hypothetical protein
MLEAVLTRSEIETFLSFSGGKLKKKAEIFNLGIL